MIANHLLRLALVPLYVLLVRTFITSFPTCIFLYYCTTLPLHTTHTQRGNEHTAIITTLKEEKSLAELRASKVLISSFSYLVILPLFSCTLASFHLFMIFSLFLCSFFLSLSLTLPNFSLSLQSHLFLSLLIVLHSPTL